MRLVLLGVGHRRCALRRAAFDGRVLAIMVSDTCNIIQDDALAKLDVRVCMCCACVVRVFMRTTAIGDVFLSFLESFRLPRRRC